MDANNAKFQNLPVEVFLLICSNLDTMFLRDTLSKVCQRFHDILMDESVWKSRFKLRWPDHTICAVEFGGENKPWHDICYNIEKEYKLWKDIEKTMSKIVLKNVQFSSIDTVKIICNGKLLVSGSRDRSIAVWNLKSDDIRPLSHNTVAHYGWVWDLAWEKTEKSLYSCSWDSTVKLWTHDYLKEVSTFRCSSSALSLACQPNLVAAGLFDSKIQLFDPRCNDSVGDYVTHKMEVISIGLHGENKIISASRDKTVAVGDIRTLKTLSTVKVSIDRSFPMSMHLHNNLLYVGDNKSYIHLFSIDNGNLKNHNAYSVLPEDNQTSSLLSNGKMLTSIWCNQNKIIVGSTDKTVRIFLPLHPIQLVTTLENRTGEVTTIDYTDSVLAVGCTNDCIEVWRPKNEIFGQNEENLNTLPC